MSNRQHNQVEHRCVCGSHNSPTHFCDQHKLYTCFECLHQSHSICPTTRLCDPNEVLNLESICKRVLDRLIEMHEALPEHKLPHDTDRFLDNQKKHLTHLENELEVSWNDHNLQAVSKLSSKFANFLKDLRRNQFQVTELLWAGMMTELFDQTAITRERILKKKIDEENAKLLQTKRGLEDHIILQEKTQKKVNSLNKEVDKQTAQVEKLNKQLEKEQKAAAKTSKKANETIEELEAEVARLERKRQSKSEKISNLKNEIDTKGNQIRDLKRLNQDLAADLEQSKQEAEDTESVLSQMQTELDQKDAVIEQIRTKLSQKSQEVLDLKDKLSSQTSKSKRITKTNPTSSQTFCSLETSDSNCPSPQSKTRSKRGENSHIQLEVRLVSSQRNLERKWSWILQRM